MTDHQPDQSARKPMPGWLWAAIGAATATLIGGGTLLAVNTTSTAAPSATTSVSAPPLPVSQVVQPSQTWEQLVTSSSYAQVYVTRMRTYQATMTSSPDLQRETDTGLLQFAAGLCAMFNQGKNVQAIQAGLAPIPRDESLVYIAGATELFCPQFDPLAPAKSVYAQVGYSPPAYTTVPDQAGGVCNNLSTGMSRETATQEFAKGFSAPVSQARPVVEVLANTVC